MLLFLDCETHLIGPRKLAPPIVCTAYAGPEGPGSVTLGSSALSSAVLLDPDVVIVGHNIAFDLASLLAERPDLVSEIFDAYAAGRVRDTMIRQHLLDIGYGVGVKRSYALDACYKRATGRDLDKGPDTWRLRYAELDGVPLDQWPREALAYPAADVEATRAVYLEQENYPHFLADQDRQTASAFARHLVAAWGLEPHAPSVDRWEKDTRARFAELARTLVDAGLMRRDESRDTKAASARLESVFAAEGLEVPRTPSGAVSLSEDACLRCHDPVMRAYGQIGAVKARLSKDLPILRRTVCHTRFGLAASGRATSSDPNIQNLGREGGVRECFRAPAGYVYVICDYSTLELRTLAEVQCEWFGSSPLADAINGGLDVHLDLAATLLGVSYQDAKDRLAAGDKEIKHHRQIAKGANFGFPGGLGAGAMVGYVRASTGITLSLDAARDLRDAWLRRWTMGPYFERIRSTTEARQPLEQLRSGRLRGGCGFTDGANTMFQGLAADIAHDALRSVVRRCYEDRAGDVLGGCRVVNFVHDEIDMIAPEATAHEAAEALREEMIAAGARWCKHVKIEAVPALARALSKGAEPKHDDRGRLIPCD
jgi:hypothetical protein